MFINTNSFQKITEQLDGKMPTNIFFYFGALLINRRSPLFCIVLLDIFEAVQEYLLDNMFNATVAGRRASEEDIAAGNAFSDTEFNTITTASRKVLSRLLAIFISLGCSRLFNISPLLLAMFYLPLMSIFYMLMFIDYQFDHLITARSLGAYCMYLLAPAMSFSYALFYTLAAQERVNHTQNYPDERLDFRSFLAMCILGYFISDLLVTFISTVLPTQWQFNALAIISIVIEVILVGVYLRLWFLHRSSIPNLYAALSRTLIFGLSFIAIYYTIITLITYTSVIRAATYLTLFVIIGLLIFLVYRDRAQVRRGITGYRPWLLIIIGVFLEIVFGFVKALIVQDNVRLPKNILLRLVTPEEHAAGVKPPIVLETLCSAVPDITFLFGGLFLATRIVRRFHLINRFLLFLFFSVLLYAFLSVAFLTSNGFMSRWVFIPWQVASEIILNFFFSESMNLMILLLPTSLSPGVWLTILCEIQFIAGNSLVNILINNVFPNNVSTITDNTHLSMINPLMRTHGLIYMGITGVIFAFTIISFLCYRRIANSFETLMSNIEAHGDRETYWAALHVRNQTPIEQF